MMVLWLVLSAFLSSSALRAAPAEVPSTEFCAEPLVAVCAREVNEKRLSQELIRILEETKSLEVRKQARNAAKLEDALALFDSSHAGEVWEKFFREKSSKQIGEYSLKHFLPLFLSPGVSCTDCTRFQRFIKAMYHDTRHARQLRATDEYARFREMGGEQRTVLSLKDKESAIRDFITAAARTLPSGEFRDIAASFPRVFYRDAQIAERDLFPAVLKAVNEMEFTPEFRTRQQSLFREAATLGDRVVARVCPQCPVENLTQVKLEYSVDFAENLDELADAIDKANASFFRERQTVRADGGLLFDDDLSFGVFSHELGHKVFHANRGKPWLKKILNCLVETTKATPTQISETFADWFKTEVSAERLATMDRPAAIQYISMADYDECIVPNDGDGEYLRSTDLLERVTFAHPSVQKLFGCKAKTAIKHCGP